MECFDKVKNERFCRPMGGGIEFTEMGENALRREFKEEMDAELTGIQFLRIFENIFVCDGAQGHEIVLLYKAELSDKTLYSKNNILCNESGAPFTAKWINIDDFRQSKETLYPEGLMAYIDQRQ